MPCILLFETEYSLEFVYTNLPFLSRPSDTKIQTAITWCLQQQKSQKFENVRLWTSIFRYENLKIVSLITSELFNRNLSIVHPTLFFNSVIAPVAIGFYHPELTDFPPDVRVLSLLFQTFQCQSNWCSFLTRLRQRYFLLDQGISKVP